MKTHVCFVRVYCVSRAALWNMWGISLKYTLDRLSHLTSLVSCHHTSILYSYICNFRMKARVALCVCCHKFRSISFSRLTAWLCATGTASDHKSIKARLFPSFVFTRLLFSLSLCVCLGSVSLFSKLLWGLYTQQV